jgi:hypothetical protein
VQRIASEKLSIPFEIYRIISSENPTMPKLHEIESYYTYDMIMDCIEILDLRMALEEESYMARKKDLDGK